MILKDLMNHFEIEDNLPDYLLNHTFNEVFLDGKLTLKNNTYEIVVKTRQDVTHMIFIKPLDDYPVVIMSELPNGSLNGMKFGKSSDDVEYVNKF